MADYEIIDLCEDEAAPRSQTLSIGSESVQSPRSIHMADLTPLISGVQVHQSKMNTLHEDVFMRDPQRPQIPPLAQASGGADVIFVREKVSHSSTLPRRSARSNIETCLTASWEPVIGDNSALQECSDRNNTPWRHRAIQDDCATPEKFSNAGINIVCAPGKTVEFDDKSFMKITKMLRDPQGELILVGKHLYRQTVFGAKVPKRQNEVIWMFEDVPDGDDGLSERRLEKRKIVRNRELYMTNRPYPKDRTDPHHPCNHPSTFLYGQPQNSKAGPLLCRLKYRSWYGNGVNRNIEERWEFVSELEADDGHRLESSRVRENWRGPTELNGSHSERKITHNVETGRVSRNVLQSFTFGDAFCGAGGSSCGARMAGLHVAWSFDHNSRAIETYRLNFPQVDSREVSVETFTNNALHEDLKVDVLHISPPCQFFSPAHTVMSPIRDETNQAALLCVGELLERVKPRIVTLEQTSGLEARHSIWFNALLNEFIRTGYAIHWKVVSCADYGVPQTRRRLVIIGAGPGEKLPQFPQPTHGSTGMSILPFETIGGTIARIPRRAPNHDITRLYATPRTPTSPNETARTITTNGGVGNSHPSGLRDFTVREYACLQTVPLGFQFAGTSVTAHREQVGNMVPPKMACAIDRAIIRSLERDDRRIRRPVRSNNQQMVRDVDDDMVMIL